MTENEPLRQINVHDQPVDEIGEQLAVGMLSASAIGLGFAVGSALATRNPSLGQKVFSITMETAASAPLNLIAYEIEGGGFSERDAWVGGAAIIGGAVGSLGGPLTGFIVGPVAGYVAAGIYDILHVPTVQNIDTHALVDALVSGLDGDLGSSLPPQLRILDPDVQAIALVRNPNADIDALTGAALASLSDVALEEALQVTAALEQSLRSADLIGDFSNFDLNAGPDAYDWTDPSGDFISVGSIDDGRDYGSFTREQISNGGGWDEPVDMSGYDSGYNPAFDPGFSVSSGSFRPSGRVSSAQNNHGYDEVPGLHSSGPQGESPAVQSFRDRNNVPIVLDLNDDGVDLLLQTAAHVLFDWDDDGYRERTAWVGPTDGFLVIDAGDDGQITLSREIDFTRWLTDADVDREAMFGLTGDTASLIAQLDQNGDGVLTDLEALAGLFDSNNDGVLDQLDTDWSYFKIWQDIDSDGEVDVGEFLTLSDHGITEIGLNFALEQKIVFQDGSYVNGFIDVTRLADDGTTETISGADVSLAYNGYGVAIIDNDDGTTDYFFQDQATEQHIDLQMGDTDFSIDHRNLDETDPTYVVSVTGNDSANTLNARNALIGIALDGGAGNDHLKGSDESDLLVGGAGADTLDGNDGNDFISGGAGVDKLRGGAGNDTLFIDAADLTSGGEVDGGDGYDGIFVDDDQGVTLVLEDVDVEFFQGNSGNDTVRAMAVRPTGEFIDPIYAKAYTIATGQITGIPTHFIQTIDPDTADPGEPILSNFTSVDTDILDDGGVLDWFVESSTAGEAPELRSFSLLGGAGNDTLSGAIGRDFLVGEEGNDRLEGNFGNDVYLFGQGHGHDRISDSGISPDFQEFIVSVDYTLESINSVIDTGNSTNRYQVGGYTTSTGQHEITTHNIIAVDGYGGVDTLQLGYGIRFEDLTFTKVSGNLDIDIVTTDADGNAVSDSVVIENFDDEAYRVEILAFANGMALDISNIGELHGSAGNDVLDGDGENNVLRGLAGVDALDGGDGADFLYAGQGNDFNVRGGLGDDSYYYSKGDGHDQYIDSGGTDTVFLGKGIAFGDLRFDLRNANSELKVWIDETTGTGESAVTTNVGSINLEDFNNAEKQIERLILDDGTTLYAPELLGLALATDGDDNIAQNSTSIWIDGGAGDDTIRGSQFDDILFGGAGRDVLFGYGGDDVLWAGEDSGPSQYLRGGGGNDTYLYAQGDGTVIIDSYSENGSWGTSDRVVFTDLNLSDITASYTGVLNSPTTDDSLLLDWAKDGQSGQLKIWHQGDYIESFEFADGTRVSKIERENVTGRTILTGTDDDDIVNGTSDDDKIFGGLGNDTLSAGAGTSWQYLYGEEGNDTYLYSTGQANLYINSAAEGATTGTADRVVFTDLTLADITVSYTGVLDSPAVDDSLLLDWAKDGQSGQLKVYHQGDYIESFEFADGSTVSSIGRENGTGRIVLTGTDDDDVINGTSGDDKIFGGLGDDTLSAGVGSHWQYLYGQEGNDTYLYSTDQANINLNIASEGATTGTSDRFVFTDLNLSDITVSYTGVLDSPTAEDSLYLDWTKDGQSGRVQIWHQGDYIESFEFADGSTVSSIGRENGTGRIVLTGTDDDDVINGTSGDDKIFGGLGDDTLSAGVGSHWQYLYGQEDNDTYLYSTGQANLYINSAAEGAATGTADRVVFTDLNLSDITVSYTGVLDSPAADDSLLLDWAKDGQSGQLKVYHQGDYIESYEFADGTAISSIVDNGDGRFKLYAADPNRSNVITGSNASEYIFGGSGDDVLNPGGGANGLVQYLYGYDGNDRYEISSNAASVFIRTEGEDSGSGDADRVIVTDLALSDITIGYQDYGAGHVNGNALKLSWDTGTDAGSLRIAQEGQYIESFEFADGTAISSIVDNGDGRFKLYAADPNGSNVITGTDASEYIFGGSGDDVLNPGGGSSGLLQYLDGYDGNDRYEIGSNAAFTVIRTSGEGADDGDADTVAFMDLSFSDITIGYHDYGAGHVNGNALKLSWDIGTETGHLRVAMEGQYIEQFEFADGTSVSSFHVGGSGDDVITGDDGDNALSGEGGIDTLVGGLGNDIFMFRDQSHSGVGSQADTISDFKDDGADKIDLSQLTSAGLVFRGTDAFDDVDQVRIEADGADVLVDINLAGDSTPEMQIRLTGITITDLGADDFLL